MYENKNVSTNRTDVGAHEGLYNEPEVMASKPVTKENPLYDSREDISKDDGFNTVIGALSNVTDGFAMDHKAGPGDAYLDPNYVEQADDGHQVVALDDAGGGYLDVQAAADVESNRPSVVANSAYEYSAAATVGEPTATYEAPPESATLSEPNYEDVDDADNGYLAS